MKFDDIVKKYGYNEEETKIIKRIYDSYVGFYGKELEELIYNAFMDTKMYLKASVYETLKDNNMIDANGIVTEGDMKRAAGVYSSLPIIKYENGEYKIVGVKRVVVNDIPINEWKNVSTLVHEIGHLIKAYNKEFSIDGDILITRSGLMESIYKLSVVDGVVNKKLIEERNVGLEEGLNSCLEEDIVRTYFDQSYQASGYGGVRVCSRTLIDIPKLNKLILTAQITKDFTELIDYLGEDLVTNISRVLDTIYKNDLDMFANIFSPDKFQTCVDKREELKYGLFKPLLDEVRTLEGDVIGARNC